MTDDLVTLLHVFFVDFSQLLDASLLLLYLLVVFLQLRFELVDLLRQGELSALLFLHVTNKTGQFALQFLVSLDCLLTIKFIAAAGIQAIFVGSVFLLFVGSPVPFFLTILVRPCLDCSYVLVLAVLDLVVHAQLPHKDVLVLVLGLHIADLLVLGARFSILAGFEDGVDSF